MVKYLILFVFLASVPLKAEFSFNDDILLSGANHMDVPGFDTTQNADIRFDNRFIVNYTNNSNFKAEFHWLLSTQNYKDTNYDIPVQLVVKDDKYSLFNLTNVYSGSNYTIINKIDRLNATIYNDNYEFTLGRTALTWSRGRIFHVTDFFNPQNPGFYDGDYKIGADMAYANINLGDAGSLAIVANPKRNHQSLDVTTKDSTFATRYLYSNETLDFSVMLAQYLQDYTLATGMSTSFLFGSVLRGDISFWLPEFNRENIYLEYVVSIERSFDVFDKTSSLYVEYFHNDFGYNGPADKAIYNMNATMVRRFQEEDTYLYGKDYMAIGFTMELSTHINFAYSNTINLYDYSSFNSISLSYSATDNLTFSLGVSVPFGKLNDEFGKQCGIGGNPNECFELTTIGIFSLIYNL